MKVYYLSSTGHAYIDYVNPKFRLIEFKDGYHPITNDAIWRSGAGEDAVMYVWQGRSSPEGQSNDRVRFVMKETNRLKDNRQPIKVSKLWSRYIKHAIYAGIWLLAIAFMSYVVYIFYTASRMT